MADSTPSLEELLEALAGNASPSGDQLREFYEVYLSAPLFVPRRDQPVEFPGSTDYPSDFTDILGVSSSEITFVPAFSSEAELKAWYPQDLQINEIRGQELCRRMPENWWISLNPGSDAGKEFSPWEIARLKGAREEELEEVIAEQLGEEPKPMQFRALVEEEKEMLKESLTEELESFSLIHTVYCGVQVTEDGDNMVFGILSGRALQDDERSAFESAIGRALIGDSSFETHFGCSLEESPNLALFRLSEPFFQRTKKNHGESWRNLIGTVGQFLRKPAK